MSSIEKSEFMGMHFSKSFIKRDLYSAKYRRRELNEVRTLFDLSDKNNFTIDDQTWNDLIMDEVFDELDRTYSAEGEAVLYKMLRNLIMNEDELKKRGGIIDLFKKDVDLIVNLRKIFYEMIYDKKNSLISMINEVLPTSKLKYYIYCTLSVLPVFLIAISVILNNPKFMIILMLEVFVNMYIYEKEHERIDIKGLLYLSDLIEASKKISNIRNSELSPYTIKLKNLLSKLEIINRSIFLLRIINAFGGVFQIFAIPFLIEERTYYRTSNHLLKRRNEILELYNLVGELDALTSISIYENSNKGEYTNPRFVKRTTLKIVDGIHPLIKKPVPNSIEFSGKGVVLTGTNMSGKSTFLRMISINILLAQTFNFALAQEYEGCFFNVVSSISPKDDIMNGKSYYLAEAESILRILKASENKIPVFCVIDEIFRGTNPLERISSSAEILNYINIRKAICIVATHDRELLDMLKGKYDFYYFSEDVNIKTGLNFDYKIKKGISKTRNAIKLLEYIGYPKEIIQNSYKRIEQIKGFI